jgi:hypothetical protein
MAPRPRRCAFGPFSAVATPDSEKSRVVDREPLFFACVEPMMHVSARLEGRDHLLGHRDSGDLLAHGLAPENISLTQALHQRFNLDLLLG